jgi:cytochrome c oxidase subunit II
VTSRSSTRRAGVLAAAFTLAAFGALVLVACEGRQSALLPRGPRAAAIYELTMVMFVGGGIVFALVMTALAVALWSRGRVPAQRPDDADSRADPDHVDDKGRLAVVAVATGITVLILVALFTYNLFIENAVSKGATDALRLEVMGRQWWWDVTYPGEPASLTVRTANELHIPTGRPVEIVLTSTDVIHSFWVPNLHGKIDAIPGRKNHIIIQADVPGTYRGQCAEFCGLQHALMAFYVIAEPPEDFERWRAGQAEPAVSPEDELAVRGQEVFLRGSCVGCHAIRGTPAMAAVGPDLTHLASRRTLAAATLDNKRGQLGGWILDPQHIKPGAHMPANEIAAEDLHALLHYLETLR